MVYPLNISCYLLDIIILYNNGNMEILHRAARIHCIDEHLRNWCNHQKFILDLMACNTYHTQWTENDKLSLPNQ